jgi:cytoskeletal protein RodZ
MEPPDRAGLTNRAITIALVVIGIAIVGIVAFLVYVFLGSPFGNLGADVTQEGGGIVGSVTSSSEAASSPSAVSTTHEEASSPVATTDPTGTDSTTETPTIEVSIQGTEVMTVTMAVETPPGLQTPPAPLTTIGPFQTIEASVEAGETSEYLFQGLEGVPAVFTLRIGSGQQVDVLIRDDDGSSLAQQQLATETNAIVFVAPTAGKYYFVLTAVSELSFRLTMEYVQP